MDKTLSSHTLWISCDLRSVCPCQLRPLPSAACFHFPFVVLKQALIINCAEHMGGIANVVGQDEVWVIVWRWDCSIQWGGRIVACILVLWKFCAFCGIDCGLPLVSQHLIENGGHRGTGQCSCGWVLASTFCPNFRSIVHWMNSPTLAATYPCDRHD